MKHRKCHFEGIREELGRIDTVDGLYRRAVKRYPARTFIHALDGRGEIRITYDESARRLAALIRHLRELQLAPQERVICYLDEQLPSVLFSIACAHLCLIPVPISPVFSAEYVVELARRVEARTVFTVPEFAPRLETCGLQILCIPRPGRRFDGFLPLNVESLPGSAECLDYLSEIAGTHGADDAYYIQPTSGSTGAPKLVIKKHGTVLRGIFRALDIRPDDEPAQRVLMIAPLLHGNGYSLLMTTLYLGAELAMPTAVGTNARLEEIRRLDPTYIQLVPRMLQELYRQHLERGGDAEDRLFGPSARLMYYTGATPDPALLHLVARQGIDVIPGYSSSESGAVSVGQRGAWREGYVGKILPDVAVKVAEDGELCVRSPGVMRGYYADEELTKAAFTEDGFYRTGDHAKVGDDGSLEIVGRKKDVFNTYDGSNIYPARIEERIAGLSWVHQVVLIGDQRPYIVALIVPKGEYSSVKPHGFLDEVAHAALYASARLELEQINQEFALNEQVRKFVLFANEFAAELYLTPDRMKPKRNRQEILRLYREWIEPLYMSAPPPRAVPPLQIASLQQSAEMR